MKEDKIAYCTKCEKRCNWEWYEGEDDDGYYRSQTSDCCGAEVAHLDKEEALFHEL